MSRQSRGFASRIGQGWLRIFGGASGAKAKLTPAAQPTNQTPPPAPGQQNSQTQTPAPGQQNTSSAGVAGNTQGASIPPKLNYVEAGNIKLVTYSPEEALLQVQEERNKVDFGMSFVQKLMANFNQYWSLIGPLLFAAGTIGEIFLVLWERQKNQNVFAGFVIVIVSVIAEGGLLAVSFSSKLLRNRADKRPTGWTRKEEKKLGEIRTMWWLLSIGVAATQIAFIISQTRYDDIGLAGLTGIALARSAVAAFADYYTAFISEEKPSSADEAIETQDKQTEFSDKMLSRKVQEIDILNAGALRVQEAAKNAAIKQEKMEAQADMDRDILETEKELLRLENEQKIAKLKADFEEQAAWSELRIASTKAMQARITKLAIDQLSGHDPTREIASTLHYLINEVREMRGELKQLPSGQSGQKEIDTGQLPQIIEEEEED